MKKLLVIVALGMISALSVAEVPNEFKSGEVATAQKFNENFSYLFNEIKQIKDSVGDGPSSIIAKVNGVDMKVRSTQLGTYNITTPTGAVVTVNADGYPNTSYFIYESDDCTGQAYVGYYYLSKHLSKPTGHVFANPKLSTAASITYLNGEIGYLSNNTLTKVNHKSIGSGSGGIECQSAIGTYLALKVLPNDPKVTGIHSFPLIISGVGSDLKISSTEVGTPAVGSFDVYANGTKIGTTDGHPRSLSSSIFVKLDGYENASIYLNKDGTYFGDIFSSETLYYESADCSGIAYSLIVDQADRSWWNTIVLKEITISNQGDYYTLSSQAYRVTKPFQSYRYSDGDLCTVSNTDGTNSAYLKATLEHTPKIPKFTPPITIEGYVEPTPYDSLPVAF